MKHIATLSAASLHYDQDPSHELSGYLPVTMKSVLVLEDNFIIAMEAEDILLGLGVEAVHIATSIAQAISIVDRHAIDFALLDVDLGADTSFGFAGRLATSGVPFGFVSGYSDNSDFPAEMRSRPRILKPFNESSVKGLVDEALASRD